MKKIKIGTRGSKLALAQTKIVEDILKKQFPKLEVEVVVIKTQGDKILDKPLSEIGDKGLFINEFENAILNNEIDIAVHSAKDLPSELKENLDIIATPKRADARDVLIKSKDKNSIMVIGTSSPRREYYMSQYFPKADVKMIRGNVDTRLNKLANGEYDAIVLAKAGLDRLNIFCKVNQIFNVEVLDIDKVLPAACQGIIAIEARKDFEFINEISKINDDMTFQQYKIEREVLKYLQVSCSEINAVYSKFSDENIIELAIMYKGKITKIVGEYSKVFEQIPKIVAKLKS